MYSVKPKWVDLQKWATEMFREECLATLGGKDYRAPERVMRSLTEYQLGMFPKYTPEEHDTMRPTRVLV